MSGPDVAAKTPSEVSIISLLSEKPAKRSGRMDQVIDASGEVSRTYWRCGRAVLIMSARLRHSEPELRLREVPPVLAETVYHCMAAGLSRPALRDAFYAKRIHLHDQFAVQQLHQNTHTRLRRRGFDDHPLQVHHGAVNHAHSYAGDERR